ncbi:MAG: hypothetical protein ACE5OZ_11040 [Candidatus Heimdallarchaeota archaeon]
MPLKTSKNESSTKDNPLDDYIRNIERILQMHDSVEVIRSDGTVVRLK